MSRRRRRRPDPDAPLEVEAYRELIPDFDRFLEVVRTKEPRTLRVNRARTTPEALRARLEARGYGVEADTHHPDFLRITRRSADELPPVSDTLEHWAGHFYIQRTVTGWAASLLDPRPGERVLDLCSAPGGKTTHLAELMGGRGEIVAVEVNEGRIRALLGNLYRMGHPNVIVVAGDGRFIPTGATFDRVMVDVPCSAQGTLRRKRGVIPVTNRRARRKLVEIQSQLLRRAIEVTRPGGTLLYVTCTFDPLENEGVLTEVLRDGEVEVEPIDLPLPHARGVTSWEGRSFDARMSHAIRLYPHLHDSGGLFLCRLRRRGDAEVTGWSEVPERFPDDALDPSEDAPAARDAPAGHDAPATRDAPAAREVIAEVIPFYGIDRTTIDRLRFLRRGTTLWAHALGAWPFEAWAAGRWRSVSNGFRAFDLSGRGPPRPTNDLLQFLDDGVTERRVELSPGGWIDLLAGRRVRVEGVGDGYVALVLGGEVVGRGFVRDGVLASQIPRGRTRWLRAAVELEAKADAG
ncbi:MAG: RsmB/NOP family class I SAM-dependent RNA methyltransferase [Longimicrobiales bacterium]|nr:RsmB/NOP family class I SAM-dependent RNA methyltransferase [Longimicrobiales bacterium]